MSNSLVPPLFPEQPDFQYIWKQSESYKPKKEKKIQSLSAAMDVDEDTVRQNLPDYEALFASQQLYNDTVARSYPTFYRNLSNTPFVAAARDDMGNLIETEGWWNEIANAYNVARDTVAIGNIGTRAMLDGRDLYPYERRKIERARQRQRAHMQSEPGFLAAAAELAGTMQETLGYSLAAGYTAGAVSGPAAPVVAPIAAGIAGFATSFNLEAGNLYADLIMDGYTPAQATEIGASYGALIAGFEAVGLKFAGKPIKELGKELFKKQGRDLLRRETAGQITGRIFADYAKGILAESTTEGVQEILSELGKARASQIYRPENLYEPEYYETFQQAFVHTAKGMVVLGGVPSAVRLANDSIKSANANYDFEKAREAAEIRSRSQAPEAQSQIDAEAAEADSYNSSYYIRAQDFLTGIRAQGEAQGFTEQQVRETVEANSPGLMSRIDEAAERDGDVELTKADWDKAFHDTKFRETTLQHTAFEEDGLTKREADENEAIREKAMQDASEEAKQALQDQETFEQELREVRRDLRNQLDVALEGMDAAQTMTAAANAAVLSGFIRRNALAMGIGPKEFVEKHLPQIVQQRLGGQQTQQQARLPVSPEAMTVGDALGVLLKNWDTVNRSRRSDEWFDGANVNEGSRSGFQDALQEGGDRLQSHGMSKESTLTGAVENLLNMLGQGLDPARGGGKLDTAPLVTGEQGSGAGIGTASGTSYKDGPFILVAREGQGLSGNLDGLGAILVNETNADIVEALRQQVQAIRPDVVVESYSKAGEAVRQVMGQQAAPESYSSFDQPSNYTFTESDYRPEVVAWAKEQFGDRVAPNGKPVYQNFVRWFGDSKVVDKDGKPLVVYHGTTRSFDTFARSNRQIYGKGYYFGSRPETANNYTLNPVSIDGENRVEQGGQVYPAFLSLRNPFIWDDENLKTLPEEFFDKYQYFKEREAGLGQRLQEELKKRGYDGIIVGSLPPAGPMRSILIDATYVAFDSNQIKSTQNQGDFSADPGILYSKEAAAAFDESPYNKKVAAWAKDTFGNRVAPNGKPVYQNFLEFFGDSMVLDEEGRPLVMYHGTKAPGFKEFEYRYLMHGLFGVGIYTTENSKVAGGYAGVDPDAKRPKNDKGGGIFPLLVSIKNPIDMDAEPDLDKWRAAFPDVEFPDGIEKNEYAYRHVEEFFGIRSEAVGWKTRGAAKTFLARSEKRQAPSARDINEGKSSSPDILRLATEIRELQKKGNRIHRRRKDAARSLLKKMGFDPFATFLSQGLPKEYSDKVEVVSSELLQYSFQRSPSDNPNIPGHLNTYKVEYVDSYFGKQTVVVGAIDSRNTTIRFAVERDLSQRMLGAFGASIDRKQADNPYSLANGSYPFKGMRLEGKALNEVTDAMREAQEDQFELEDISESLAEKENELEALRLTDDGQDITELVQNGLVRMGHDGITHLGGGRVADERHRVYIAFEPNQIKSFYNKGDFSPLTGELLFSKEGDKKVLGTASFEGTDAIQKILLDPDAKPTTLMHELMHWNLELMATIGLDIETKVAQAGYEATVQEAQMLGDIQRLLKWSGFEGTLTEWRAMTTDQRRPFHEAVAVSFETYLYEGVAPSRELRGVFSRLADYIRGAFEELVLGYQRDYQQEFGRPLPGLNDDVRAIFGRMMSAERDVEMFLTENDLDAMMVTREEWVAAGRDASEYDEYEREFKDAIYEAKAELTQRRMQEVAYQQNARRRIGKDLDRELREATKQIRTEEELAARLTAVQQVREWIKTGKYLTEEGEYTPLLSGERKLDRDAIAAIDPELAKSMPRSLLKRGGLPLEVARQQFGFESVEQMLQALAESRSLKEEVDARTDQRVLDELTDLTDPIVVEEKIQSAIHNKIRQRIVALELKYLLNNGRSSRLEMRLATDIALRIIETTPTGDINLRSYSAAASRARKKALKALKDGDMEAAAFAKRQELVNEALIREGGKARKEVRKLVRMNQRVFKQRTDKAIAEAGYDVVVVKALRALLNRLGIGTLDGDPAEMLARFQQEDPGFFGEVRPQIEYFLKMDLAQPQVGDRRKPMEHLTVGDVRSLRGLAKRMMKRAKDKRSATIGERKANIDTLRQEAQDTLESNVEVTREPDDKSIFGKIRDYLSDITRFEHLFRRADGGKVGIWTQMFRQVKDAANKYREELRQFLSGDGFDFEGKLRSLDLKIPGGVRTLTMDLPAAGRKVEIGKNGRHAKTELIHLAMHYYGNSSNRKRLVEGYAGRDATEDTMQQVDVEIRRFLEQQIQQGILTRKDFEFMQSVFDQLSSQDMLGRAQKVMKNLRGYEMNEVKVEKFTVQFPDGEQEFGGGYIPIRFKKTVSKESEGQGVLDEDMGLEQQAQKMLNILPGFTKDRVKGEVGEELHLGLSDIANHAAEVYRFINMAEPIDSVSRVLQGRGVENAFRARFGNKAYTNLEGWLKRSAFQRFDRGEQSEVGSMLLRMSRNANMSVMFLNIGNTLQNYAGLLIPMRRVGKRRLISSLIHSAFNKKLAAEVASKSKEMKARLERQIFDIYNSQTRILTSEDSAWARLQSWSDKYAYVLQQITQNHVDVAVWQAAYNQETEAALKEGMSAGDAEARAVAHADSIVRQSQMAGEKEDISAFEAGGSLSRALFPFKSWFINWFNNAATQGRLDMKVEDRSRVAAVASTYLYMLMIPAVLAQAAVELARGEDWDDDDDGYGDDMLELFARSQFDQVVGGLPVYGDISRLLADNWFDDEYWNNRYPVAPWIRAWERIANAPVRKDAVDAGLDMATQAANLMGVPAVGVWNRVNLIGDEIAGELESESTYDLIRGAVTGQRSDLQRLSQ